MSVTMQGIIDVSKKGRIWFNQGATKAPESGTPDWSQGSVVERFYTSILRVNDSPPDVTVQSISGSSADAFHVPNQDDLTTTSPAVVRPAEGDLFYVTSDRFSGCVFQVFMTDKGSIVCAHVYKGASATPDLALEKYAREHKWKKLYTWDSANIIVPGKIDGAFVVCVIGNVNIDIACLLQNSKGQVVQVKDWKTIEKW